MRNIFILISAFIFVNGASAQKEFTLNGKISDSAYEGWNITLQTVVNTKDSSYLHSKAVSKISGGIFQLKGSSNQYPEMAILLLTNGTINSDKPLEIIILEQGISDLTIDDVGDMLIKTPLNLKNQAFRNREVQLMSSMHEMNDDVKQAANAGTLSENQVAAIEKRFDSIKGLIFDNTYTYVKDNIKNKIGEFYFISSRSYLQPAQLKELYALSSPEFQASSIANIVMTNLVWGKEGSTIGEKFKDIELPTVDGRIVKLSDYTAKGKVVLVDFWASWCGPCLKEMPLIVSLYSQYKSKGFEIVGISLDDTKSRWLASINRLNMTWPQLSDLGGWDSKAARMFNVTRIPQNYILDAEGRIVAHDLHGDALKAKLSELLD